MLKKSLLLSFLLSFQFTLLIGQKVLKTPVAYQTMPDGNTRNEPLPSKEGYAWIVFSDRSQNKIYDQPSIGASSKTANFLDKFFVVEDQPGWLKVAKYSTSGYDEKSYKLKNESEVLGWLPKENLLLWNRAIVSEKKVIKKALALVTPAFLGQSSEDEQGSLKDFVTIDDQTREVKVNAYNWPSSEEKYKTDKALKMFRFYYVLKQNKDMILISMESRFSPSTIQSTVFGWVPKKLLTIWEDRLCLEPNSESNAVKEREREKIPLPLFFNQAQAKIFKTTREFDPGRDIALRDPGTKRWAPEIKRMAVTQSSPDKIYKTNYVTDVRDTSSKSEGVQLTSEEAYKIMGKMEGNLGQIRTINLMFVIDGGESMASFVDEIDSTLKKIKRDLPQEEKKEFTFKAGAVVYRDYADADCPKGDLSISKYELTQKFDTDLANFLVKQSSINGCNSGEKTQAVRKGIKTALEILSQKDTKLQTNFIILFGGAGDNEELAENSEFSDEKLSRLYAEAQPNFIAYQFNRVNSINYTKFIGQVKDIIDNGNKAIYKDLSADKNFKGQISGIYEFTKDESIDNYYSFRIKEDKKALKIGKVTFPTAGNSISTYEFQSEMASFTGNVIDYVVQLGKGVKDLSLRIQNSSGYTNSMLLIMKNFNDIDDNSELQNKMQTLFRNDNYQFAVECYTPYKIDKLQHSLYEKVLYFTEDELIQVREVFNKLRLSGTMEEIRNNLYNAMKAQLAALLGVNEANEAIKKMSGSEIMEMLTGYEPRNTVFNKISNLEEIRKSGKISNSDIELLKEKFDETYNNLNEVFSDDKYRAKSDGVTYYWIPEKFFP